MSQADGERDANGGEGNDLSSPSPNQAGEGAEPAAPSFGPVTDKPRSALFTRTPLNPEESCFGCVIGAGVLFVSVLIWAYVYWLNAPEFHQP